MVDPLGPQNADPLLAAILQSLMRPNRLRPAENRPELSQQGFASRGLGDLVYRPSPGQLGLPGPGPGMAGPGPATNLTGLLGALMAQRQQVSPQMRSLVGGLGAY